jgi:hypothetical protein
MLSRHDKQAHQISHRPDEKEHEDGNQAPVGNELQNVAHDLQPIAPGRSGRQSYHIFLTCAASVSDYLPTYNVGFREGAFTMKTLRTPLIAVAVLAVTSCAAFAQVTVITPESEHVYSSDPARPQQLLDDEALRLQNERRARIARELEEAADQAASKSQSPNTYQPPTSAWESPNYQPPRSGWDSPNYQPPKSGWADR